ncbi:uncharacterized protein LOC106087330 [Stomoxys calcitrans]|uniref:uncharacterized protein LOC106087330 n=1 Tax=Stomoxys calcitrans TaxID=35570 RepID=UPI0027E289E5|nr:uncharacterized protein LOC106087330 [Stomoxys calcitrans]
MTHRKQQKTQVSRNKYKRRPMTSTVCTVVSTSNRRTRFVVVPVYCAPRRQPLLMKDSIGSIRYCCSSLLCTEAAALVDEGFHQVNPKYINGLFNVFSSYLFFLFVVIVVAVYCALRRQPLPMKDSIRSIRYVQPAAMILHFVYYPSLKHSFFFFKKYFNGLFF